MLDKVERVFRELSSAVDFCSLRVVQERREELSVLRGVVRPAQLFEDAGAMLTVVHGGGTGYAAASDFSEAGLRRALEQAREWAARSAGRSVADFSALPRAASSGEYASAVHRPWSELCARAKLELLTGTSERLRASPAIVSWSSALALRESDTLFLSSAGARIEQRFRYLSGSLHASANRGAQTQTRSFDFLRQGGLELLEELDFAEQAARVGAEALELLDAPDCPVGRMDLLLAPDQMELQIHESIGHPLELDRLLGDERNFAGTSFVTPEMFGSFRYGSELLNVSFDPARPQQVASYAFDDEGMPARREWVIERGILQRGLGGALSQQRSGLPGVASSRACAWNRPPIDRMANLNLEPGESSFAELVAQVERGVFMETNSSWSIDDSRNKFQFGCQRARLIRDGELGPVVRNPGYRGITTPFWRSLKGVGDASTLGVLGTPTCGKGEPNQAISVGHASPVCLFADVEVFGGGL